MFNLNSLQKGSYFKIYNNSDQLERISKYITAKNNDEQFNIPQRVRKISYLSPYLNDIVVYEDAYIFSYINVKENLDLNLISHSYNNVSFKQYDDSCIFQSSKLLTTFDYNQLHQLNYNVKIYCCGNSHEEYLHNYFTDWPITNSISLVKRSRLQNCFNCRESEGYYCPYTYCYTPNAFEIDLKVLPNMNSDYVCTNGICQYRSNFGEFNFHQSIQFESKIIDYGENSCSNEIGVCLRELKNIYMDPYTEKCTDYSNSYLADGNQQTGIDIDVDDGGSNDVLMGTEQLPIIETMKASDLRTPTNLIQTPSSDIYNAINFRKYEILESNSKDHTIPDGDDFVQMFQQVSTFEMCFLENKSVFARNPTPDLRGIGFDVGMLIDAHQQFETEHDVNEAKKTENAILSMYPLHNRNYQQRC